MLNFSKLNKSNYYKKFNLYYLPSDKVVGGLIANNNYEVFESSLIRQSIKKGNNIIDVGANIGFYTLMLADLAGSEGRVYAFEPDKTNFKILKYNIKANDFNNVKLFNVALSLKPQNLDLFLSEGNYGDHRLYEDDEEKKARKKIKVKCETIDHLFQNKKIALIKIDTQGYEPYVIGGAKKTIEKYNPTIFLEYWPYAYRKSGGNYKLMIKLLKEKYKKIFFIEEKNKTVFETNEEYINDYCKALNGKKCCNLIFSKFSFSRLKV